jgi:hypothetical protein
VEVDRGAPAERVRVGEADEDDLSEPSWGDAERRQRR